MIVENKFDIEYSRPTVHLIQQNGIGSSEFAGRTAYDSFDKTEHSSIKILDTLISSGAPDEIVEEILDEVNDIESSNILDELAWTYFHHSVLEHSVLTYHVKGMSRGVLQELARHRIASYTVRSTRYTMGSVINAFNASLKNLNNSFEFFTDRMLELDIFVTTDRQYNLMQIEDIFNKFFYQFEKMGKEEFSKIAIAKSSLELFSSAKTQKEAFEVLQSGKSKRNVGDAFKHVVNDNWKVNLVCTFNLRSLKNFLVLRDSGSAWFQIRWLAEEMKKATPSKYLDLIVKSK